MKKRISALALSGILLLALASCGNTADTSSESNSESSASVSSSVIVDESAPQEVDEVQEEQNEETEEVSIPDPVVYSGTGDDVVQITPPEGKYVFRITGNQEGRHFSVKAYDSFAEYIDLLVNTTSQYSGVTYDPTQSTAMLEISATGDWTIELVSIYTMDALISGNSISGEGDAVLQVFAPVLTADIQGNDASAHFSVKSYDMDGGYLDLLVNTTDPYSGTVMMGLDVSTLVISAEGPWTITAG